MILRGCVEPYKRKPIPPRVSILTDAGAVDEDGKAWTLDGRPPDLRTFTDLAGADEFLASGRGHALRWNGTPIRLRPGRPPEGPWRPSPLDVMVIPLDFPPRAWEAVAGIAAWRDGLAFYGAGIPSTIGSAAWSLLRAQLAGPLWLGIGDAPPVGYVLGGRQEQAEPPGTYTGPFIRWDLPAAYASVLGAVRYGGWWRSIPPKLDDVTAYHADGAPVFVRAQVRIPREVMPNTRPATSIRTVGAGVNLGPLPRRPRRKRTNWESLLIPVEYPTGKTMRGIWGWPEVEAAMASGCDVRIETAWAHLTLGDHRPFAPWWAAVSDLRGMGGFPGTLAKMTGNALWGQFTITEGVREIVQAVSRGARVVSPSPLPGGGRPRAPDLAEVVTSTVRARLWGCLVDAGPRFLCAHTDGAWVFDHGDGWTPPGGDWRASGVASRIDLVSPQALAYWPVGAGAPSYTFAGVPEREQERAFRELWRTMKGGEQTA